MEREIAEPSDLSNAEEFAFGGEVSDCGCGRPARLFVSRTPRYPGRKFWGCSHQGSHCNFFKWHDEWVNERTLLMLQELRRFNANLEKWESETNGDVATENSSLKGQMAKLNSNVKKTNEALASTKNTKEWFKFGFFAALALLGFEICHGYGFKIYHR